jgi:hypothetical protein
MSVSTNWETSSHGFGGASPKYVLVVSKFFIQFIYLRGDSFAVWAPSSKTIHDNDIGGILCFVQSGRKVSPVLDLSVAHFDVIMSCRGPIL